MPFVWSHQWCAQLPEICCLIKPKRYYSCRQLNTTILISRDWDFFWDKLSSDLNLAGRNIPKNMSPKFFPRHFKVAKFFGRKNYKICMLDSIQNSIYGHYCSARNLPMLFLLLDGPCSGITGQPLSICTHESLGPIDKSLDDINRAHDNRLQSPLLLRTFALVTHNNNIWPIPNTWHCETSRIWISAI